MKAIIACFVAPLIMLFLRIDIDAGSISNILGLLVAIAGAIFTIMSIWVAFLYPNVLKTLKGENLVNVDFSAGGEDTARLKEIISVIVQSASTMIAAVVLLILVSTINEFGLGVRLWVAGVIQFVLLFVSGLQICALISTIRINLSFMDLLEKHRSKRAKDWDT
ncbi:hypothetical protein [Pseudomonas fluorescens]|uniref:hypothetical protein n=1 Tax=Pseudomonas fluorescens TaxID=294 RepID=UPI00209E68B4|nr:hypothetical protein [Pseudomonas fluorescens]MCP1486362.1 hypothetical protein [Pseudomonas fluorescens]